MSKLPEFLKTGERARLIPVTADSNGEQRAASIALAAMRGVFEFRKVMLGSVGVRVGNRADLDTWTEVVFKDNTSVKNIKDKKDRPDGLLVLNTGKSQWKALIEAKIGNAEVNEEQLSAYLQLAKQNNIDAVITITNQFVALPEHHPVKIPKTLTRSVGLYHWSWMYLLTQATLLLDSDEIESEDQKFVLEEVVRYLSHDKSGVSRFTSMNREWKDVIGKVKSNATLNKSSDEVENTVSSWHQEQRDLCLVMSRKLGRPVKLRLSRSHRTDPQQRLRDDVEDLVKHKTLSCDLEIPDAAADLDVTADLATRTIICAMRLGAPQDKKRASARVNWLTRQLKNINDKDIYIKALRPGRAEDTQAPLSEVMENPDVLNSSNSDVVPTVFEVFYMADLAGKFAKNKVFIDEIEKIVPYFYEMAGQRLQAWVAPPPKIRKTDPALENEEVSSNEGNLDEDTASEDVAEESQPVDES
ncbi:hypothetical protein [Thiohalophilus sp.]|uniref:hypothetical protein n=1 Tax=Thiohalophilus sp. TaxID=3028392 RepID=UPI002ACE1068|nr:hypothetical protein [Thiohalophilus sp.]MDZ7662471.1 hypothetical protein [Thiohalophilus sp.]